MSDLFPQASITFLKELFESQPAGQNYTWIISTDEGLFNTLDVADAERASKRPSPETSTLAAHANHVLYALRDCNSYLGRPKPEGNWETTWTRQTVTPAEWQELKDQIRDEYDYLLAKFEAQTDWTNQDVVYGFAWQAPHMAYHLGAMRLILKLV